MLLQKNYSLIFCLLLLLLNTSNILANSKTLTEREDVRIFINELMDEEKFSKKELLIIFNQVEIRQDIIDLMNRPAEKVKPWYDYKNIFLTDKRIKAGVNFWKENLGALEYAEKVYGVAPEIVVAIIGVETYYGKISGKHRVIDALSTLAFEYPKRAKFFRRELKHYLVLCHEQNLDPLKLTGSYAGAMGYGQFMPSSYQHYAVNFDGKGSTDIWNNTVDAIGSVANYFKQHGWQQGKQVIAKVEQRVNEMDNSNQLKPSLTIKRFAEQGIKTSLSAEYNSEAASLIALEEKTGYEYWLGLNNFYTITRYNHSAMYAMAVYQLSQMIKKAHSNNQ